MGGGTSSVVASAAFVAGSTSDKEKLELFANDINVEVANIAL